jgi:hypothetical protein
VVFSWFLEALNRFLTKNYKLGAYFQRKNQIKVAVYEYMPWDKMIVLYKI